MFISNTDKFLSFTEKIYNRFFPPTRPSRSEYNQPILSKEETNASIKEFLSSTKPRMLCRFGNVELSVLARYLKKGKYTVTNKISMTNNAGFFPPTTEMFNKFARLYIEDIQMADMIAVWFNHYENKIVNSYAPHAKLALLGDFSSPYFCNSPWSEALEGKKVLVIHPFEESILHQYHNNREKLFDNPKVLPKFELKTLKAIQSIGGEGHPDFQTWFEALKFMKNKENMF